MGRLTRLAVVASFGLVCSAGTGACAAPSDDDGTSADAVSEANAKAVVDLHLLDIWAQPLAERTVTVTRNGSAERTTREGDETLRLFLGAPATYAVHLEAKDHVPLDLTLDWDGTTVTTRDASLAPDGGRAGVTLAHSTKRIATRTLPAHDLYLGLRHAWFSAQARPARRGNAVELLMDGEEAWRAIDARLRGAREQVLVSTWWWDSHFELVRDNPLASTKVRDKNTILRVLDSTPAQKRILVGQFLGSVSLLSWMTSDSELRSRTNDPLLQFMREGNDSRGRFHFEVPAVRFADRITLPPSAELAPEEPIPSTVPGHDVDLTTFMEGVDLASMHQKFFVVDGQTAFVGGMNLRETDWDSSEHRPYDARRLPFDATQAQREAAANKVCPPDHDGMPALTCDLPKPGPRKDYMLRIDGPSAADAADVFSDRWNALIAQRVSDAQGRTELAASPVPSARGDVAVQITTTSPKGEHGIAETWFNAVRNAERFVYIEDQYFRVPMLNEAIAKRMDEVPGLQLVVVTKPVTRLDPGCAYTKNAYELFQSRYPDRFTYLRLASFDPVGGRYNGYAGIDVHAKMLVVDDVFMSVGSANKNNRGLVYEIEMNAAVHDRAFVTASRRRMIRALVPDAPETDDPAVWVPLLRSVAGENQRVFDQNQNPERPVQLPRGFVHPLTGPKSCAFPNVGPDAT